MGKRYIAALAAIMLAAGCNQAGDQGEDAETVETATETEASETPDTEPADAEGAASAEPTDYDEMANWLCHPEKSGDACDVDLSWTVVNANGSTKVRNFEAAENPPVDCFYVYPTVSLDETANSDLVPGDEEFSVITAQFARFGQACRLFAPMYRQITLPELRRGMSGQGFTADMAIRYSDVKGAWDTYMQDHNDGRGVVLIGHSQGSSMLQELVRKDIAGSDAEDSIVSLMPIGMTTHVDAETGNFGPYEPCTTMDQTGCIISYVSFRSDVPPPASSRFGVNAMDGRRALCVNPAELTGDDGVLDARLSASGWYGNAPAEFANGEGVDTPFASVPGLLTGECVEGDNHTYLEITVNADPEDPRTDTITGDVVANGEVNADWGLHLVDMNVAMGNLVEIVGAQAEAWVAAEAANEAE